LLTLQNISKRFQGKTVLSEVSLTVPSGATHALIGSSGSGKTTLLRITLGLLQSDEGTVQIDDARQDRIGYVPQEGGLFAHFNGEENVALVAKLRQWPKEKILARIEELRKLVELDPAILTRYPFEMSGGQKQRIAIMRAAMLDPTVLLLDEPMGALDPLIRMSLQEELKTIFARLKKTVLLVTHDLHEAVFLADTLTLLHDGKVVQTGSFEDLSTKPADPFVTLFLNAQRTLPGRGSRS
jgi:osmoprotectant transport system ATP-binding protein